MQIVQSKSNIVEKIIRDKQGRLVRATFAVYENGGRIKARLVNFVYLTNNFLTGAVLALKGLSNKIKLGFKIYFKQLVPIPVETSETLYSSGSKPRAPTF